VVEVEGNKANNNQWEISRILNWRYVSTIFQAIEIGGISPEI